MAAIRFVDVDSVTLLLQARVHEALIPASKHAPKPL
jgi:hypothetical protein